MTDGIAPTLKLHNGVEMPAFGLGTSDVEDRDVEKMVAAAIEAGYRLIDTAEAYGNERGVGAGIRASGIAREEIFLTTKFSGQWHGFEESQKAFAGNAERLGVDYIDLLLIHWPIPAQDRYVDAWRGMVKLLEEGKVRAIGGSNLKPAHIDRLIQTTGITPHVNQIQLNPWVSRQTERRYHAEHGIVTESWAPMAKAKRGELFDEAPIAEAARRTGRTPAQVVLRWHVQQGLIPIPKTSNLGRLTENIGVFDFELTDTEIDAITAMDNGEYRVVDSDRDGPGPSL